MVRPQGELEFHQAYGRITDGYIAVDREWRYTHVNARAAEMLGRRAEDLIGKHVWTEFPTPVDNPFRQAYERAMSEQRAMTVEAHSPAHGGWFENRIYPSPEGLTVSFHDVTGRRRAELLDAGQRAILEGIAAQDPLAESLERIARLHEELNPGSLCSILLLDLERRHVVHGAAPSLPPAFNNAIDGLEVGDGRGSCGSAIARRERVVVADIATHPYWSDYRDLALANDLRACWSTPVLGSREQVLASFAVYYREAREPDAGEIECVDRMLAITSIAVESDQLLRRMRERDYFFDMSLEIYCIYDTRTRRIVQANPTFTTVTGHTSAELAARPYCDFVHPDDIEIAVAALDQLTGAGMRVDNVVYRFHCSDGSYRWLAWESIVGPDGLAFAVGRDLTEHRQVEEALAHADTHDLVTQLPHRRVLEGGVSTLIHASESVWVFLVGLDRFHTINESMGHVIGDDVLRRIAHRLRDTLGATGQLARFAGDQFVVAVPDFDQERALRLAERLREAVSRPIDSVDYRLVLTASVGISHWPGHGETAQDLMMRAEAAMGRAKLQGRDGVCQFSTKQMRDIEERLVLGHRLRGAIERGEMALHYQPQYNTVSGELAGFEALLRWKDTQQGWISPVRFIPVAETLGLMPEIGGWVIGEACRQASEWLAAGFGRFSIAVNVSAQELQRQGLVERVAGALERYALPADVLSIELTESSLMENVGRARTTLLELKSLGTRLALDDFGTGYSSLAYLKHFPIDKLKIDQSFVRGLPDDGDDAAIARTIVAMGHQLRMLVAAEGVESARQADFLAGIGCDQLQGYHLGRPVTAIEAEASFRGKDRRRD